MKNANILHEVMWGVVSSPSMLPCFSPDFLLLIFYLNLSKKQTSDLLWLNLKGFRVEIYNTHQELPTRILTYTSIKTNENRKNKFRRNYYIEVRS